MAMSQIWIKMHSSRIRYPYPESMEWEMSSLDVGKHSASSDKADDIEALAAGVIEAYGAGAVAMVERQLNACERDDSRATWLQILERLQGA
jgi:hypothetical protein